MTGLSTQATPERRVFILRVWQERPGSAEWRGQIQDVQNGQTVAILDAGELLAFIQDQSRRDNSTKKKRQGLK